MVFTCCNPLNLPRGFKHSKNRRRVVNWIVLKFPAVSEKDYICENCRIKILKLKCVKTEEPEHYDDYDNTPDNSENNSDAVSDLDLKSPANKILKLSSYSPLKSKRLKSKTYKKKKLNEIRRALFRDDDDEEEENISMNGVGEKIINACKIEFQKCEKYSEKLQLLTIPVAGNISINKIAEIFECPRCMVLNARFLFREKGLLALPDKKKSDKKLPEETEEKVIAFYKKDNVCSRLMPGKKDCVIIRDQITGKKEYIQKRLLLNNLSELYNMYKVAHGENYPVSASTFTKLRPPECVFPGSPGTHSICVCVQHENPRLMFEGAHLNTLTEQSSNPLTSITDCLSSIVCDIENENCVFKNCENCPGIAILQERLDKLFEDSCVTEITYKQWMTVDRCNIETVITPTHDFIDKFCIKIESLIIHSYIAKKQSEYLNYLKDNLKEDEAIIIMDYSQNFNLQIQDCIQGFYWTNTMATLHVSVIYYLDNGTVKNMNHLAVSESLTHDAVGVSLIQSKLIPQLKQKLPSVRKIHYFSDGAGSQYKNKKNFSSVIYHEEDFNIKCQWNFFATSHGKGPCDGVGGSAKRSASNASLQMVGERQMNSPRAFFDHVVNLPKTHLADFFTLQDHEDHELKISKRFAAARPLSGTQQLHQIIPIRYGEVKTKPFSTSTQFKINSIL